MILLDTSVLIDALRTRDPKLQQLFLVHSAAICGVTRAEVLYGARDAPHYGRLLTALSSFPQISMTETLWDAVGNSLYLLRTNGVTVPFQDVVIATLAIENDVELWTRDKQFVLIQSVLPSLKLFPESP